MLQQDQQNPTALAGLARCYLKSGDLERAEQTIALVPPDKARSAAIESVRAAIDLARDAAAVDHLLEIVRRQRTWNEEAARKQLVQFFEAWGPKDAATIDGRKRLSSLLFA